MSKNIIWYVSYHPMTMSATVVHHYDEGKIEYFEDKDEAEAFKLKLDNTIMEDGRWIHTYLDWEWKQMESD